MIDMYAGIFNAWVLSAPIILIGTYVAIFHRAAAKRMADMTGYTGKEKALTVSASASPHLFTLLAVFIPLSPNQIAAVTGSLLYSIGLTGFALAVVSFVKTKPGELAIHGTYKISRNPMYVTALMAYAGIAIITLNLLLTVLLIIMFILHHRMILAEESACLKRFGKQYELFRKKTPRYLFL